MENNQQTTPDLITPVILPAHNPPFVTGVIAISLLAVAVVTGYTFSAVLGIMFFLGSFITAIIGVITIKNYKTKYPELTPDQQQKLQWGKNLSALTLILSSLTIVAFGALLVYIGINGFGR
jgi:purine-cytosine permease-like protein